MQAQNVGETAFTTVSIVNGKVLFQQLISTDEGLSEESQYGMLQNWAKRNYAGNPLLQSIRFNRDEHNVSISLKEELPLSKESQYASEKVMMSYRFDVNVTSSGAVLTVRDISYQSVKGDKSAFLSSPTAAEQTITNSAISAAGENKNLLSQIRQHSLDAINQLYVQVCRAFELK